jgi:tetratricopeptide (TPR) repeat protein
MTRTCIAVITAVILTLSVLEAAGQHHMVVSEAPETEGPIAPLLENLGTLHHPITTQSPRAQQFFDQGLRMVYAFNHAEAVRAFREAARLDPECAMAYWGHALALGPNINMPMEPETEPEAHALAQKAQALKGKGTNKERAYIEALTVRYSGDGKGDRQALDAAYAQAMAKVAERHPEDVDAATLYAEALMDLRPWDYWTQDGQPQPGTLKIVSILESVLERHPDHPGAHHYYIHAVEASRAPERALPNARRLGGLMPAAGHLVHMPSHIYMRVGEYAEAAESNVRAIAADEDYIAQCNAQGIYPLAYYPHNIHFLWSASTMEGRSAVAINAAQEVAAKIPAELLPEIPLLQNFVVTPLYAYARFGKWDKVLNEPRPADNLPFMIGIWHYTRGIAFGARGELEEAAGELENLRAIASDTSLAAVIVGLNSAGSVLAIAAEALAGELAAKRGDSQAAIGHLCEAIRLQDGLIYNEPPDWHYPVRQSLGAVLLEAGQPVEAEAAYREDLWRNPHNGWSLYGLLKSLRQQGKVAEAAAVEAQFQRAWSRADVTLTASRF